MEVTNAVFSPVGKPFVHHGGQGELIAYADVIFDNELVVKGVRLIKTPAGKAIVAFPSRPTQVPCHSCSHRNSYSARFCAFCGELVHNEARVADPAFHSRFFDVVHPVSPRLRESMSRAVFDLFREFQRADGKLAHEVADIAS